MIFVRLIAAVALAVPVLGWQGGNVVITVKKGTNLPSLDGFGDAAGFTDAYVKFTTGKLTKKTTTVTNSLNPEWEGKLPGSDGEAVTIGILESGTTIKMEAWDEDTGLEGFDDLIGSATLTVQECWTGAATAARVDCLEETEYFEGRWKGADCLATDSSWGMEERLVCNASTWVDLSKGTTGAEAKLTCVGDGNGNGNPCVLLDVVVVPLTVEPLYKFGGDGSASALEVVEAEDEMLMYLDQTDTLDGTYVYSSDLVKSCSAVSTTTADDDEGSTTTTVANPNCRSTALYLRNFNEDKNLGDRGGEGGYSDYLKLAFNLPTLVYMCRWKSDNDQGLPAWMVEEGVNYKVGNTNSGLKWSKVTDSLRPTGELTDYFECFQAYYPATVRDRYGSVVRDAANLGSNLPSDKAISATYMYALLFVGDTRIPGNEEVSTAFTYGQFALLFAQFFVFVLFFGKCTWHLLSETNLRLDRLEDFLLSLPLGGDNGTVVALLFDCPGLGHLAKIGDGRTSATKKNGNLDGDDSEEHVDVGRSYDPVGVQPIAEPVIGEDGRELSELEVAAKEKKEEAGVNLHFAMHIYFSEKAVQLAAFVAPLVVGGFGLCCIGSVNPAAVGAGVFCVSVSFACWAYAVQLAQGMDWRLNDQVIFPVSFGFSSMLVFVLSAVFFEPRVYWGGESVNFVALTTVFLTLNMVPNVLVGFMIDERFFKQQKQYGASLTLAASAVNAKRRADGDDDETNKWVERVRRAVKAGSKSPADDTRDSENKRKARALKRQHSKASLMATANHNSNATKAASERGKSAVVEKKKGKGGKKNKGGEGGGEGGSDEDNTPKPLELFWCCKAMWGFAFSVYIRFRVWCERERATFVFLLWLFTGWFGGEFIYLEEYEHAFLRTCGFLFALALSTIDLAFTVVPVLVVVWVLDWRSLPNYLWHFEGKEGANPYSSGKSAQAGSGAGGDGGGSGGGGSSGLTTLLAPCYSITSQLPAFEFSQASGGGSSSEGSGGSSQRTVRACYGLSVAFLGVYVYAAWWRCPEKSTLALVNAVTLLVLDSIHFAVTGSGSAIEWSPGFRIMLRTGGRLLMAFSGSKYWLVGYAFIYGWYGTALLGEVLEAILPNMDEHEAAGIIFFGYDANSGKTVRDMAGKPIVLLGYLTFLFLLLLVVVAYAGSERLPVSTLPLPAFLCGVGSDSFGWPSYVFAAAVFLTVLVFGFLVAALRASYLRKHGLLDESLVSLYLRWPSFNVENMFAGMCLVACLCLGGFLFAATGSAFVLVVCVFAPPALCFLALSHTAWAGTDFQLVVWPPTKAWDKIQSVRWGCIVPPPPGASQASSETTASRSSSFKGGGGGAPAVEICDEDQEKSGADLIPRRVKSNKRRTTEATNPANSMVLTQPMTSVRVAASESDDSGSEEGGVHGGAPAETILDDDDSEDDEDDSDNDDDDDDADDEKAADNKDSYHGGRGGGGFVGWMSGLFSAGGDGGSTAENQKKARGKQHGLNKVSPMLGGDSGGDGDGAAAVAVVHGGAPPGSVSDNHFGPTPTGGVMQQIDPSFTQLPGMQSSAQRRQQQGGAGSGGYQMPPLPMKANVVGKRKKEKEKQQQKEQQQQQQQQQQQSRPGSSSGGGWGSTNNNNATDASSIANNNNNRGSSSLGGGGGDRFGPPQPSNAYSSSSSGAGGAGGGGGGGGGDFSEDVDLNALLNTAAGDDDDDAEGGGGGGGRSGAKAVQQKVLPVRGPRFGTTAVLLRWKQHLCSSWCCRKLGGLLGKGGKGKGGAGGKKKEKTAKKEKEGSSKKKEKKKKDGKAEKKVKEKSEKREKMAASKGATHSMRSAGIVAKAPDQGYEDYSDIGVLEAVVDGWLYDHELFALMYGALSLLTVLVGGVVLFAALKRDPELPSKSDGSGDSSADPGSVARPVPEQMYRAVAAAAVGSGGLDAGWVGHAVWMGIWAAVFLYMAVAKWLSVGGPLSVLGCAEAVLSSTGLVPERLRQKWAARQSQRQEALGELGLVADVPDFVHPLVAWCTLLSTGMVVCLCCTLFLGAPLRGNVNSIAALWLLDLTLLYPIVLGALFEFLSWRDTGFKSTEVKDEDGDGQMSLKEHCKAFVDRDGDGSVSVLEVCTSLSSTTTYTAAALFACVQFFVWGDTLWAATATVGFGGLYIVLMLLRDWSLNDYYLSESSEEWANNLLKIGLGASFLGGMLTGDPSSRVYAASVFFVILMARELSLVCTRVNAIKATDPDSPVYFSPYVFPCYVYSSRDNYLTDESDTVLHLYKAFLAGVLWGVVVALANSEGPALGVAVTSLFLLAACVTTALLVSYTNTTLMRNAAKYADSRMFAEAAGAARKAFKQKNAPIAFACEEYELEAEAENAKMGLGALYAAGGYSGEKEEDTRSAAEVAASITDLERNYTMRYYSLVEGLADGLNGEGPMGWACLGCFGKGFGLLMRGSMGLAEKCKQQRALRAEKAKKQAQEKKKKTLAAAKQKNKGKGKGSSKVAPDQGGGEDQSLLEGGQNRKSIGGYQEELKAGAMTSQELVPRVPAPDAGVLQSRLQLLPNEDRALTKMFALENRCACHFQLLVGVATEAKLRSEKVTLQKFLRNYRFSLISNGIGPPETIFSTESYASIDLKLVALWLSSLSGDERGRFHVLRERFAKEQAVKEGLLDEANEGLDSEALMLESERKKVELMNCERFRGDVMRRRATRLEDWVKSLSGTEADRFREVQGLWLKEQNVAKPSRADAHLKDRYENEVLLLHSDESLVNAREQLSELEKGGPKLGVRKGKHTYSRERQFFDPNFAPVPASLGYITKARDTDPTLWKSSIEMNLDAVVFSGGSDPDDVCQGLIQDSWLLSAVQMLSAAGGVGDGGVDEQIERLLVHKVNVLDGKLVCDSEVGAYAVRLYKNGQWETVVVDDHFPVVPDDNSGLVVPMSKTESRGAAAAYSKEMAEIWVSLIEKAFAKYYGSYAQLEKGFVHHALRDLTGAESEMTFIAGAARGNGRSALWENMRRHHAAGYIMGCGSLPAEHADKSLQDSGLVFNATYCIFDVRFIDNGGSGLKLLQLRNPPGDHGEWRGDWGDESPLWSRRLKRVLNWSDDGADNTFWMSFDDWCDCFRQLYVCRFFDPTKWTKLVMHGSWSMVDPSTGEGEDTAMGLPHPVHNVNCEVAKNPTFALTVRRPTDVRLVLTQRDSSGISPPKLNPVALYVVLPDATSGGGGGMRAQRVHELTRQNVYAHSGDSVSERTIELNVPQLRPGVYMVLCATFAAGQLGPFELTAFANSVNSIAIDQVYPPVWRAATTGTTANATLSRINDDGGDEEEGGGGSEDGLGQEIRNARSIGED